MTAVLDDATEAATEAERRARVRAAGPELWLLLAQTQPSIADAVALLKAELAPMRVMAMDAFDLRDEKPAQTGERCALYLARSDGHCWSMTGDAASASALFITPRG
jgi:hypothetical protein